MSSLEKIVWQTLRGPRQWVEPWYAAYALLGAVSSGLIPVLLPLMMVAVSHRLADVGYVMGAFNMGALSSPLWGRLAEEKKIFRSVFCGGLVLEAASLAFFTIAHGLPEWFLLALLMGAGSSAVATCATLFVVEFHPREEWTPRIGWLQTFNGTGQVAGLLCAGLFSAAGYRLGLMTGAGLLVIALLPGLLSLKTRAAPVRRMDPSEGAQHRQGLDFSVLARFTRVELLGGGLLRHAAFLNLAGLKSIRQLLPTRFGRFLLSWFFIFLGVSGFFAYFPLFLKSAFKVAPGVTSLTYALAAGGGVLLYNLTGGWARKFGDGKVYKIGRLVRLCGFMLMLALMFLPRGGWSSAAALLAFVTIVLSWPVISVTGTELTSTLSPMSQGAAQGLNNAANAAGTVIGTYLAGGLMHFCGYACIPALGAAGLMLSLLIGANLAES